MNYLGVILGIFAFSIVCYSAYIIFRDHLEKKIAQQHIVLPYLSAAPALPNVSDNLVKGETFEKFVLDSFDEQYFKFHEWRSDKSHDGKFPISNSNPDLLFEFRHRDKSVFIAIECKWRSTAYDNAIHWATSSKINNYYAYQQKERVKVFVALGVGGSPAHPQDLYIVPLDSIQKHMVYLTLPFLKKFYKTPGSKFFLDTYAMTLQ